MLARLRRVPVRVFFVYTCIAMGAQLHAHIGLGGTTGSVSCLRDRDAQFMFSDALVTKKSKKNPRTAHARFRGRFCAPKRNKKMNNTTKKKHRHHIVLRDGHHRRRSYRYWSSNSSCMLHHNVKRNACSANARGRRLRGVGHLHSALRGAAKACRKALCTAPCCARDACIGASRALQQ
jgi:hypothetical protein